MFEVGYVEAEISLADMCAAGCETPVDKVAILAGTVVVGVMLLGERWLGGTGGQR